MAAASTLHIQHLHPTKNTDVPMASHDETSLWPSLPSDNANDEWEVIPPSDSVEVSFDADALAQRISTSKPNPRILKHCQSSPDLRHLAMDESDESTSGVFVEKETASDGSTGVVMVSNPPSVWSAASNKLSFRDAILKNPKPKPAIKSANTDSPQRKTQKLNKPKFVVVQPTSQKRSSKGMLRNSRSMGNLKELDHVQEEFDDDEEILGATDACEYYSRKSHGVISRKNGQKTRPDEAKRLQMTMAKKSMQRGNR
eukprot:Nitzschia sp. Nitz4//scaffold76_size158648//20341//21108//NITZ4_002531-RA/size158648-processed-gene-0.229-mRNA-1//1//CDS//3329557800//7777//frame0